MTPSITRHFSSVPKVKHKIYDIGIVGGGEISTACAMKALYHGKSVALINPEAKSTDSFNHHQLRCEPKGYPKGIPFLPLSRLTFGELQASYDQFCLGHGTLTKYKWSSGLFSLYERNDPIYGKDLTTLKVRSLVLASGMRFEKLPPKLNAIKHEGSHLFYQHPEGLFKKITLSRSMMSIAFYTEVNAWVGELAYRYAEAGANVSLICPNDSIEKNFSRDLIQRLSRFHVRIFQNNHLTAFFCDPISKSVSIIHKTSGQEHLIEADYVFAFLGPKPPLIPENMNGPQIKNDDSGHIVVDPSSFMTSVPGVFALGSRVLLGEEHSRENAGVKIFQEVAKFLEKKG